MLSLVSCSSTLLNCCLTVPTSIFSTWKLRSVCAGLPLTLRRTSISGPSSSVSCNSSATLSIVQTQVMASNTHVSIRVVFPVLQPPRHTPPLNTIHSLYAVCLACLLCLFHTVVALPSYCYCHHNVSYAMDLERL